MKKFFEKYISNKKIISAAVVLIGFILLCMSVEHNKPVSVQSKRIVHVTDCGDWFEEINISAAVEDTMEAIRFVDLEKRLNQLVAGQYGTWSIYVKDLSTGDTISINNQPQYAASLIKLFVMEHTYEDMESLVANGSSEKTIKDTLNAMITVSDNDAYNELVRMHSASRSFEDGCLKINEYISNSEYENTGIYSTLHPSKSVWQRTSTTRNHTTAEDCGKLLEAIYNGTCVSEEASEEMLDLLLQQQRTSKIPAGISGDILIANKTGETYETQHDAAIVFGPEKNFILCVMSTNSGDAIYTIREISALVYEYLEE